MCFHFCFCFSVIGLEIKAITAGIENYEKMVFLELQELKKKNEKMVFLANSKLNSIEVLISKALIDSVIGLDEFVLKNNAQKEYRKLKEEIKNYKK